MYTALETILFDVIVALVAGWTSINVFIGLDVITWAVLFIV
jgi:hypothetical protein